MGQIDTFDPKKKGDPKVKKAGSYYESIETAVPGVQLCEHLPLLADRMERITAVRTTHHDVIDEHAAATNRMHTGRLISGTVTYPSLGSLICHERGAVDENVPPYVLIGYPNITRGPGFLGPKDGYLYLTDTSRGADGIIKARGDYFCKTGETSGFLGSLHQKGAVVNDQVKQYQDTIQQSLNLSGPDFNRVFKIDQEPDSLRNRYGGEFGQRCCLVDA